MPGFLQMNCSLKRNSLHSATNLSLKTIFIIELITKINHLTKKKPMYSTKILASFALSLLPFFLFAQQDLEDKAISAADSVEFIEFLKSHGIEVPTHEPDYQIKFNGSTKGWDIRIKPKSPDDYFRQDLTEYILYAEIKEPGQYELEFFNEKGEKYQSFIEIADQKVIEQQLPFVYEMPTADSKLLSESLKEGDTLTIIHTEYMLSCGISMRVEVHSFILKKGKLRHAVVLEQDFFGPKPKSKKAEFKDVDDALLKKFAKIERKLDRRSIMLTSKNLNFIDFTPSYLFLLGRQRVEGWGSRDDLNE